MPGHIYTAVNITAGEFSVVYDVHQSQKTLFMTSTRPMKRSWVHMGPSRTWFSALNERCEFTSMRPSTCCSCSCVFCASDESICDSRRQYRVYAQSLTEQHPCAKKEGTKQKNNNSELGFGGNN